MVLTVVCYPSPPLLSPPWRISKWESVLCTSTLCLPTTAKAARSSISSHRYFSPSNHQGQLCSMWASVDCPVQLYTHPHIQDASGAPAYICSSYHGYSRCDEASVKKPVDPPPPHAPGGPKPDAAPNTVDSSDECDESDERDECDNCMAEEDNPNNPCPYHTGYMQSDYSP